MATAISALTVNDLLPMRPQDGPPLPKFLGIYWPWHKPALPTEILKVTAPSGATTPAPVVPMIPTSPTPVPSAPALVKATQEDIAKLTEQNQAALQANVSAISSWGGTANVVTVGNTVAVISPTGVGSVIYPTETTTPEQLKWATVAVEQQLVQQGVISVDPKTGIATPTQAYTPTAYPSGDPRFGTGASGGATNPWGNLTGKTVTMETYTPIYDGYGNVVSRQNNGAMTLAETTHGTYVLMGGMGTMYAEFDPGGTQIHYWQLANATPPGDPSLWTWVDVQYVQAHAHTGGM